LFSCKLALVASFLNSKFEKIFSFKGQAIRTTFPCNLSSNIVTLQVAKLCCPYNHPHEQLAAQQISVLQVAATCCTKLNSVLLLATNPDVACGGDNTGNKALQLAHTMLCNKLQGNDARITWPFDLAVLDLT